MFSKTILDKLNLPYGRMDLIVQSYINYYLPAAAYIISITIGVFNKLTFYLLYLVKY